MSDMTQSYVGHDSFICGTWPIHMCNMTHSYVGHDSFICVTWLIHTLDDSAKVALSLNMLLYISLWTLHSHCNTLQHAATHCSTLQHTATQACMRWFWKQFTFITSHMRLLTTTYTYIHIYMYIYMYKRVLSYIWMHHICIMPGAVGREGSASCPTAPYCTYINIFMYTHAYIRIPTYIYLHIHIYVFSHVHIYMCMYVCTCIHKYMNVYENI